MIKNSKIFAHRKGKVALFLVVLILCMAQISVISALELNPFATAKFHDVSIKEDTPDFFKENFNEKYGTIRLSKTFFWIEQDKIAEYSLNYNTENCFKNCVLRGKAILYEDGKLFDDKEFKNVKGKETELESSQYYIKVENSYTTNVCEYDNKNVTISCEDKTYFYDEWTKYNGEELKAGTYEWELRGSKKENIDIDAIPNARGKSLTEWAWWYNTTGYDYIEQKHNLVLGTSASVSGKGGFKFLTKDDGLSLNTITKDNLVDATKAYLLNGSLSVLDTQDFIGNNATFDYPLENNTYYYVGLDKPGVKYNSQRTNTPGEGWVFPRSSTHINITSGLWENVDNPGLISSISSITLKVNLSTTLQGGGIEVTKNTPTDSSTISSTTINFNCSFEAYLNQTEFTNITYIENMTLRIWDSSNTSFYENTDTSPTNNTFMSKVWSVPGFTDDNYLWTCGANGIYWATEEIDTFPSIDFNVTQESGFTHLSMSDPNVVLYMPFSVQEDANNITRDYSNNNNDGTLNDFTWLNRGYSFKGLPNSNLRVIDYNKTMYNYPNRTWHIQFKVLGRGTPVGSDNRSEFVFNNYNHRFNVHQDNNYQISFYLANVTHVLGGGIFYPVLNEVYNLTIALNSSGLSRELRIYVNGQLNVTRLGNLDLPYVKSDLFLGGQSSNGANISIYNFQDYTTALNSSQVTQLNTGQYPLFHPTGKMDFIGYNFTSSLQDIELANCNNYEDTSISLQINNGAVTEFTNCRIDDYSITGTLTNANMSIFLSSDTNRFYTPEVIGNLTNNGLKFFEEVETNFTLTVDTTYPNVEITYPESTTYYDGYVYENNRTITINWTTSDTNPNNCFLFNGTANNTVTCYENSSYQNLTYGVDNTYILYASDTAGNLNQSEVNFRWDYVILENNITYDSPVYDLKETDIIANVTYDSAIYTNVFGYLYYNGTPYLLTKTTEGSNYLFGRNFVVPATYQNENKSFFFNFAVTNASGTTYNFNSSENQQEITPVVFNICNSTYVNVSYINFTFLDERTDFGVNVSVYTTFNYWINSTAVNKTYSYSNNSNSANKFDFCFNPSEETIYTNMNMEYSATNYGTRTKYLSSATLTNASQNINLYLLNETYYVKFFHSVTDNLFPLKNAVVVISKYDDGTDTYKTVGTRITDDAGKFIEYLELDKRYQYSISKDLVALGVIEKTSTCAASPCEINLEISDAEVDLWSGYYDIYATNIASNLSFNRGTKMVNYVFTDLSGLAQYFRLQVNEISYNQTGEMICNVTAYTTSGSLTCNLTDYDGNFVAKSYISRSPEKLDKIIYMIIEAFKEVLSTIDGNEGLWFAFMIIGVCALIGFWNPVVGVVLTIVSFFFVVTMGLMEVSYTIVIVVVVLGFFIMIKMGSKGGVGV